MIGFHAFLDQYGEGWRKHWRLNPEIAGGGELLDDSSKRLDTFRWIAKCDVKRVIALSAIGKLIEGCRTDDINLLLIEFANGAWGSLGGSYYNVFHFWPLEIYGTEGAVFLDFAPPLISSPKGPYPLLLLCLKKPVKESLSLIEELLKVGYEV